MRFDPVGLDSLVTVRNEEIRIDLPQPQVDRSDPMSPIHTTEYTFFFADPDELLPEPPHPGHGRYRIEYRQLDPSLSPGLGGDVLDLLSKPGEEVRFRHRLVEDVMHRLCRGRLADILHGLVGRAIDGLASEDDISLFPFQVPEDYVCSGTSVLDEGDRLQRSLDQIGDGFAGLEERAGRIETDKVVGLRFLCELIVEKDFADGFGVGAVGSCVR
jgi:hypothetical protein